MKKIIKIIIAFLITVFLFCSCAKNEPSPTPSAKQTGSPTVNPVKPYEQPAEPMVPDNKTTKPGQPTAK